MLADEFGTASNIKSRVNRLSVLGAITSVQHRLKLYTKGNLNGLLKFFATFFFVFCKIIQISNVFVNLSCCLKFKILNSY